MYFNQGSFLYNHKPLIDTEKVFDELCDHRKIEIAKKVLMPLLIDSIENKQVENDL